MSPFTPKNWINEADHEGPPASPPGTPISAVALEDLETRVTDYTDDSLTPPVGIGTATPFAGVDLHVANSVNAGNFALTDRGATRGINVIHGGTITAGDAEDMHGGVIMGILGEIGGGATHQAVFGAEIQGQVGINAEEATGINPTAIYGMNGLANYRSDGTAPLLAAVTGTPQIEGNGTATKAIALRADNSEILSGAGAITSGYGVYVVHQTTAGTNYGIYLEGTSFNGGQINWAEDLAIGRRQASVLGLGAGDGITFGTAAVTNPGEGVVTGLSKLCFTKDGNAAPRIFNVSNQIFMTGTGSGASAGVVMGDSAGNPLVHADATGIGFYGTTPIAKQTGVAVSAAGIHAALVNLGLISA